jgi:hypothetical protein
VSVAEEHEGRGQAANLARIAAADIYLAAVRQGVAPGGDPDNEADVLTDAQSAEMLGQARSLYQQVLERVEGDDALRELELSARNGLAAAALTNNEFEQGRTLMEEARQFAAASGFEQMAIWLEQRIANLDEVLDQPPLYPTEDIAAAWGPAPTDPALERGQGGAPGAGPLGPGPSPESIPMPDFGPLVPEPGLQEEPVGEGEAPPSPGPAPDGEGVGGGR